MWEFRLSFTNHKNKNFFLWSTAMTRIPGSVLNDFICFIMEIISPWKCIHLVGNLLPVLICSYYIDLPAKHHFGEFWVTGTLWKRFRFSCHPNHFNPCMHMKEYFESLAYSALLQFSVPAALTMITQQYFRSQIQVYLPGITSAVSVKAFSVVKRKSIFIWCLQLEPTLGRNVTILLLSA